MGDQWSRCKSLVQLYEGCAAHFLSPQSLHCLYANWRGSVRQGKSSQCVWLSRIARWAMPGRDVTPLRSPGPLATLIGSSSGAGNTMEDLGIRKNRVWKRPYLVSCFPVLHLLPGCFKPHPRVWVGLMQSCYAGSLLHPWQGNPLPHFF